MDREQHIDSYTEGVPPKGGSKKIQMLLWDMGSTVTPSSFAALQSVMIDLEERQVEIACILLLLLN